MVSFSFPSDVFPAPVSFDSFPGLTSTPIECDLDHDRVVAVLCRDQLRFVVDTRLTWREFLEPIPSYDRCLIANVKARFIKKRRTFVPKIPYSPFREEPSECVFNCKRAGINPCAYLCKEEPSGVVYQCALDPKVPKGEEAKARMQARADRESVQRLRALEHLNMAVAYCTEKQCAQRMRIARDKRSPVILPEDVDFQGMMGIETKHLVYGAGIALAAAAIYKAASSFEKGCETLSDGATRATANVASAATSVSTVCSRTMTNLSNVLREETRRFVEMLQSTFGTLLWVIPFLLVFWYIIQNKVISPLAATFVIPIVLSVLPAGYELVVKPFFTALFDVAPQSGLDELAPIASKLIASVFCFGVFKNSKKDMTTEFLKRIASIGKTAEGFESFMTWGVSALEACVNHVRAFFGADRIELLNTGKAHLKKWLVAVSETERLALLQGESLRPQQVSELIALLQLGYTYRDLYRGTDCARVVDEYILKLTNAFQPYVASVNSRNNMRAEPPVLLFYSGPGTGKTILAQAVCPSVLLASGLVGDTPTKEDVLSQIWQKGSSEYWNGYTGQFVQVMDDMFQMRPVVGNADNDFMNLIRMVSTWTFPLNFADLASKGRICWSSKFIYGTTNLQCITGQASIIINDVGAVTRRIKHPYKLSVKPEFALEDGKLNYALFKRERQACKGKKGFESFPYYIWNLQRHDFETGQTDKEFLDVIPILEAVTREVEANEENRVELHDDLEDVCNAFAVQPQMGSIPTQKVMLGATLVSLNGGTEGIVPEAPKPRPMWANIAASCTANWADRTYKYTRNLVAETCDDWRGRVRIKDTLDDVAIQVDRACYDVDEAVKLFRTMAAWALQAVGFYASYKLTRYLIKTVISACVGLYDFVSDLFSSKKPEQQSNLKDPKPKPLFSRYTGTAEVQGPFDEAIASKVYSESYKIVLTKADGKDMPLGQIQFLGGKLFFLPSHFRHAIANHVKAGTVKPEATLRIVNSSEKVFDREWQVAAFLKFKYYEVPHSEVMFMEDPNFRATKNLLKHFLPEKDLHLAIGFRGRLDLFTLGARNVVDCQRNRSIIVSEKVTMGHTMPVGSTILSRFWEYAADTEIGDCGAPLCILNNDSFQGRSCLGFHVAGSTGLSRGYACVVSREMIQDAMARLSIISDEALEDLAARPQCGLEAECDTLPFDRVSSFTPYATINPPISISPKSSYFQTEMYGAFGPLDKKPAHMSAVLKDGEWISPMENATANYGTPLYPIDASRTDDIMWTAMRKLTEATLSVPRRTFTFEQAVAGIPELGFKGVPRGTSPGFPYVREHKNKNVFFGSEGDYTFHTPECAELKVRVEHILTKARAGVRLGHLYVDFLKDELRSEAKVDAVQTRLISSAPLDYVIAWRMLFGEFSNACMNNSVVCGMAPGVNPYSDWGHLYHKMQSKGKECFDGDFKAFDSSEQPEVHASALRYINNWYGPEHPDNLARTVLWEELCHSRHIGGRGCSHYTVYQWNKSLPSGHPFTTIINSMYSLFALVAAFEDITGFRESFWDFVYAVTYGDDNIVNVSDQYAHVYNQKTVAASLKKLFGLTYTPGNKDVMEETTKSIEELTFLKRGFAVEGGQILCPLAKESFMYTPYWCKNKFLVKDIIMDSTERALYELSLHPPEEWDALSPQLFDAMSQRGRVPIVLPTRDAYQRKALSLVETFT